MEAALEALERYYMEYLSSYDQSSNYAGYDADYQMTVDRIEHIIDKGCVDTDDVAFLRSILPEIENEVIRREIETYLETEVS